MLIGKDVYLRALEPEDLSFIYTVENDTSLWEVSNTQTPYSRFLIKQYLENAHQDIYQAKQLRMAVCLNGSLKAVGLIDLFDYDPRHLRAGIGIVIRNETDRNSGYGSQALELLIDYSFTHLGLQQLYANIDPANTPSVSLFTKFGFEIIGVKKQWNRINGQFKDEALYQLINSNFK
ncbi:GNAT family N-acetyltransferase [Flavobacterium silvaticum]|uniref:GNAT family N-acetyltransferase n=1 Tax=Flavobacterium silvaticum TaxID=1852020 RepID=A0A972FU25_9FLAO|nr:GNAT family protein [Flavobacterium silvaticum]NMH28027.1 GNAT family N-acetyltransferase [Flavobacterium silvaticum]